VWMPAIRGHWAPPLLGGRHGRVEAKEGVGTGLGKGVRDGRGERVMMDGLPGRRDAEGGRKRNGGSADEDAGWCAGNP